MATCTIPTVPDKNVTGDNFYGSSICSQIYVDYFWNTYGFAGNKEYWDDGFGWEDACNSDLPAGPHVQRLLRPDLLGGGLPKRRLLRRDVELGASLRPGPN